MGSRSRPHRVLSVCVCVCVSRCLWVCVIEANSLQLRVITIGLYQFLSRSPSCQILAVCGRRLRGVSGSWFPRFLSPAAFLDSDRRRLVCPLLPCATRLSPYGKLRFCLRKAPLLPTESSASAYGKLRLCPTEAPPPPYGKLRLVSRCVLLLVINSLFPQLNPPVFIVTISDWMTIDCFGLQLNKSVFSLLAKTSLHQISFVIYNERKCPLITMRCEGQKYFVQKNPLQKHELLKTGSVNGTISMYNNTYF